MASKSKNRARNKAKKQTRPPTTDKKDPESARSDERTSNETELAENTSESVTEPDAALSELRPATELPGSDTVKPGSVDAALELKSEDNVETSASLPTDASTDAQDQLASSTDQSHEAATVAASTPMISDAEEPSQTPLKDNAIVELTNPVIVLEPETTESVTEPLLPEEGPLSQSIQLVQGNMLENLTKTEKQEEDAGEYDSKLNSLVNEEESSVDPAFTVNTTETQILPEAKEEETIPHVQEPKDMPELLDEKHDTSEIGSSTEDIKQPVPKIHELEDLKTALIQSENQSKDTNVDELESSERVEETDTFKPDILTVNNDQETGPLATQPIEESGQKEIVETKTVNEPLNEIEPSPSISENLEQLTILADPQDSQADPQDLESDAEDDFFAQIGKNTTPDVSSEPLDNDSDDFYATLADKASNESTSNVEQADEQVPKVEQPKAYANQAESHESTEQVEQGDDFYSSLAQGPEPDITAPNSTTDATPSDDFYAALKPEEVVEESDSFYAALREEDPSTTRLEEPSPGSVTNALHLSDDDNLLADDDDEILTEDNVDHVDPSLNEAHLGAPKATLLGLDFLADDDDLLSDDDDLLSEDGDGELDFSAQLSAHPDEPTKHPEKVLASSAGLNGPTAANVPAAVKQKHSLENYDTATKSFDLPLDFIPQRPRPSASRVVSRTATPHGALKPPGSLAVSPRSVVGGATHTPLALPTVTTMAPPPSAPPSRTAVRTPARASAPPSVSKYAPPAGAVPKPLETSEHVNLAAPFTGGYTNASATPFTGNLATGPVAPPKPLERKANPDPFGFPGMANTLPKQRPSRVVTPQEVSRVQPVAGAPLGVPPGGPHIQSQSMPPQPMSVQPPTVAARPPPIHRASTTRVPPRAAPRASQYAPSPAAGQPSQPLPHNPSQTHESPHGLDSAPAPAGLPIVDTAPKPPQTPVDHINPQSVPETTPSNLALGRKPHMVRSPAVATAASAVYSSPLQSTDVPSNGDLTPLPVTADTIGKSWALSPATVSAMPLPLLNAKGPLKNKQKEIEKWIDDRLADLAPGPVKMPGTLLYRVLKQLVATADSDKRAALIQDVLSDFKCELAVRNEPIASQSLDLGELFDKLSSGNREEAIKFALDNRAYAHALILAHGLGVEQWQLVVDEFVAEDSRRTAAPLAFVYRVLAAEDADAGKLAISELKPRGMTSHIDLAKVDYNLRYWANIVSALYSAVISQGPAKSASTAALHELGLLLESRGWYEQAHVCLLLAGVTVGSVPEFRVPLAARSAEESPLEATDYSFDSYVLTEMLEYVGGRGMPQLLPNKMKFAEKLANAGFSKEALKIAETLLGVLKSTKTSNAALTAAVSQFIEQHQQHSTPSTEGWLQRKLSRPNLEKTFNKFVSGEDEDNTTNSNSANFSKAGDASLNNNLLSAPVRPLSASAVNQPVNRDIFIPQRQSYTPGPDSSSVLAGSNNMPHYSRPSSTLATRPAPLTETEEEYNNETSAFAPYSPGMPVIPPHGYAPLMNPPSNDQMRHEMTGSPYHPQYAVPHQPQSRGEQGFAPYGDHSSYAPRSYTPQSYTQQDVGSQPHVLPNVDLNAQGYVSQPQQNYAPPNSQNYGPYSPQVSQNVVSPQPLPQNFAPQPHQNFVPQPHQNFAPQSTHGYAPQSFQPSPVAHAIPQGYSSQGYATPGQQYAPQATVAPSEYDASLESQHLTSQPVPQPEPQPELQSTSQPDSKKVSDEQEKQDSKKDDGSKRGWFGWLKKEDPKEKKVHSVKLGDSAKVYYDKELGRWLKEGEPRPEPRKGPPPPPKSRASTAGAPGVPPTTVMPPAAPVPPAAAMPPATTMPPTASVPLTSSTPSVVPEAGISPAQPMLPSTPGAPSAPGMPPASTAPPRPKPGPVGGFDDILAAASTAGRGKRRPARSRYVGTNDAGMPEGMS